MYSHDYAYDYTVNVHSTMCMITDWTNTHITVTKGGFSILFLQNVHQQYQQSSDLRMLTGYFRLIYVFPL